MTDKEYQDTRAKLVSVLEKWHPLMQMGWYNLKYDFVRGTCPDDSNTCAVTNTLWVYRRATITWYLEKMFELTDEDFEQIIIHEFAHVVLAPVTQDQPTEWREQIEYTTQTIAVILHGISEGREVMSHEQRERSYDATGFSKRSQDGGMERDEGRHKITKERQALRVPDRDNKIPRV